MARDQKTRSKASQAQKNARSNQQAATATKTLVPNTTQITDSKKSIKSDETQIENITAIVDTVNTASTSHEMGSVQQEQTAIQPSATSDQKVVWTGLSPSWPNWPTSKPGPYSTPPVPGMRSINKIRPEQYAEVDYNQQKGEPVMQTPLRSLPDERVTGPTSFDQPTAQDVLSKRKKRL
jgi:hypothetical protein